MERKITSNEKKLMQNVKGMEIYTLREKNKQEISKWKRKKKLDEGKEGKDDRDALKRIEKLNEPES